MKIKHILATVLAAFALYASAQHNFVRTKGMQFSKVSKLNLTTSSVRTFGTVLFWVVRDKAATVRAFVPNSIRSRH